IGEDGGADAQGASFVEAHLEGALLGSSNFQGANLWQAYLAGADLTEARLQGARLPEAYFEGRRFTNDELVRIRQWLPEFPEVLPPADLRGAYLDAATLLKAAQLGDEKHGFVSVADVSWNGVNLAAVRWMAPSHKAVRRRLTGVVVGDVARAYQRVDA